MTFREIINQAIISGLVWPHDISREFSVSQPTIRRWREGITEPHPIIQRTILKWLEEQK